MDVIPPNAQPGQVLGPASRFTAGTGTHIFNNQVVASLRGKVVSTPVSVQSGPAELSISPLSSLPRVGSIVLGTITRLTQQAANLSILTIDDVPTPQPFPGVIRVADVRATEKDKVKIGESFRPGDIVRAVVVSLGDQGAYYCATEKNELGVVLARGEDGQVMWPVSWKEFEGKGGKEPRKVAKPL